MIRKSQHGSGVIEILAVVSFMSLLLVIAGANLQALNSSSQNGAATLLAFFKTARTKAISTTVAYRIQPLSATQIVTRFGADCDEATVTFPDPDLSLDLPDGAIVTNTDWTLCYTPRGVSDDNFTISVFDLDNRSKTLEVLLGGAVRLYED